MACSITDGLYETAMDLATCTICLEPMKTPKHLQCFHTFCQTCISEYCKSQCSEDSKERPALMCPVCRAKISLPEIDKGIPFSPDSWAQSLPSNFFIVEILERAKFDNRNLKTCAPCERLGEKNEAGYFCVECGELYCSDCSKHHRVQKISMTHTIKTVGEVSMKDMKSCQKTCPSHPGEILKLYCCDHDIVCCSICVSVEHRKCETVKTLENAAKGVRDSKTLTLVREDLHACFADLTSLKSSYILEGKAFQEKIRLDTGMINTIRSEIKEKVDAVSDQLIAQLAQHSEDYDVLYERKIAEVDNRRDMIENDLKTLNVALEKASDVQVMATLKDLEGQASSHKQVSHQMHKDSFHVHYTSNMSKEKDTIMASLDKCFVDAISENCGYPVTCNTLTHFKMSKMFEITIGTDNNEACFVNPGLIYVTHLGENKIEIYNMQNENIDDAALSYSPFDIASDENGHLAILYGDKNIVEIVNDASFEVYRKYNIVERSYNSIALSVDHFVVSTDKSVICYEREKGTIVQQVSNLTNLSWYMHVNKRGFYFACGDIVHFQSIHTSEHAVFTDKSLIRVSGMIEDNDRNIYIADYEKNCIVQISADRNYTRQPLPENHGLDRPRKILFSADQKYFLVVNDIGKSILVFKIEPESESESEVTPVEVP